MESIWDNIKNAFKRPDNGHLQLVIINVVVFLLSVTVYFIGNAISKDVGAALYKKIFTLPSNFFDFLLQPWGLITYFFSHSLGDIFHIVGNMIGLYFFGKVFINFLGQRKFINLYVLGGLAGGIAFLLVYNLVPSLGNRHIPLVGASASVLAIATGLMTYMPDFEFAIFGVFKVKIKWIVLIYIITSYISIAMDSNFGGGVAHLGGVAMGWFFVFQTKRGRNIGKWVSAILLGVQGMFKRKPKMSSSYGGKSSSSGTSSSSSSRSYSNSDVPTQAEVDSILDKIAKSGYSSLSAEEKKVLFQASDKK